MCLAKALILCKYIICCVCLLVYIVVYCDYAASGKSLQFIEDYILKEVLPVYGNTHTTTNVTSLQSTLYRHEARDIVRNAVHASEDDAVIFVGSGCTGAVHKLIHAMDFASDEIKPIVLVGPYEHHSNLLPWREIGATVNTRNSSSVWRIFVIRVAETKEGFIDLVDLENKLRLYQSISPGAQLVGCFSAASNITGILADDIATTLILHQYGALAFWDYASAAPYVVLDMNPLFPANDQAVYKDAIFFSGHKFVGGIQTPGVLVAKKKLFKNKVPNGSGGGAVFFVSRKDHRYLKDTELREEGGTGAIVESVRLGLALQLKQNIGVPFIMGREEKITKTVLSFLQTMPEIIVLGNCSQTVRRLPIFSMLVRHPRGAFLHHNFVCAILNDVFGVQARGGCACAGPYAQDLLGISDTLAIEYENMLLEDDRLDRHHLRRHEEHSPFEMLRPGFIRISLPFFMSDNEVSYVLEALKMVATEGWKLLPQYTLNPETGEWKHHTNNVFRDRKWLGSIRYTDGKLSVPERKISVQNTCPADYAECLKTARNTFNKARKMAKRFPLPDQRSMFTEKAEHLRWFMLPSEAQDLLLGHSSSHIKQRVPFSPAVYYGSPRTSESSNVSSPNSSLARYNSLSALDHSLSARVRSSSGSSDMLLPNKHLSPVGLISQRERCYSLGSNPNQFRRLRERQCSCSSQTELSDSESRASCSDVQHDESIEAYVQEMTKEFVTEIKSELREVIATVDNALSESSESLNVIDKQSNISKNIHKIMPRNNSVPVITTTPCQNGLEEQVITRLSEFASEMKSEIHDMVSSVLASSSSLSDENTDTIMEKETDSESDKENNLKHPNLSSTDSGINIKTEPIEINLKKFKSECTVKMNYEKNVDFAVARWYCPAKPIWKPTIEAIREFKMIRDGDRIMVCLSGGKDSLSLLHTLHQYQYYASSKGIHFTLGAATVDPGSAAYDPKPLIPYLKALGVHYLYEEQKILEQAASTECRSICSFCSRMKRGRLYSTARANGYNVLALGQHLDDLAESFLMSTFHNGRLRSMKAHYAINERDLRVIRPFVYVREKMLRQFAESKKLPVISENCPACFEAPKERHRTKQLLAQQEILFPHLFASLRSALRPLISFKQTGEETKAYHRMTGFDDFQCDKDSEEEP
ncbi:hypothetical protein AGLY_005266 [Aphis glycines]|uniref:tRNA(Ile)-lysidine/2-thiocytidine synthase N-terminal domain-containing protein n=1 Tax=Aphis glycines TaxID=307491 RepID=A0A6G0TWM6_APHGL|nr:hypothetical protein AGLY_005266 [Aphis glycines]